jgi:hypothetical protein
VDGWVFSERAQPAKIGPIICIYRDDGRVWFTRKRRINEDKPEAVFKIVNESPGLHAEDNGIGAATMEAKDSREVESGVLFLLDIVECHGENFVILQFSARGRFAAAE